MSTKTKSRPAKKVPAKKPARPKAAAVQQSTEIILPALNQNSSVVTGACETEVTRIDVAQKLLKTIAPEMPDIAESVVRCVSLARHEVQMTIRHRYAFGMELMGVAAKYKGGGLLAVVRVMEAVFPTWTGVKSYVYENHTVASTYTEEELLGWIDKKVCWRNLVDIAPVESPKTRKELLQLATKKNVVEVQEAVREAKQAEAAAIAASAASAPPADNNGNGRAPAKVDLRAQFVSRLTQLGARVEQTKTIASAMEEAIGSELGRLSEADRASWSTTTVPRLREVRNVLVSLQELPSKYLPVVDKLLEPSALPAPTTPTPLTTASPHQVAPQRTRSRE